jgi:hypothetical protein
VSRWWTSRTRRGPTERARPRRSLSWLGALLAGTLAAAPGHAEVDRAAFLRLASSVLKVEAIRVQGGYSLGSGVVVAPHKVVTNCHVTRDATEIHVLRSGLRLAVDAQASDVEHDLCVLRVPDLQAAPVALGRASALRIGEPVTALGYTGGLGMQNVRGDVVALHRLDGGSVIQSSNWFNSGASGGGLFDDELRLVGILTFRLRGGAAHYFAAPVEWIEPLLGDDRPARGIAPFGAQELAFWQRPQEAQPDFLKAAVLERNRDWPALDALSSAWSRGTPADPEPWYLRGLALAQLGRLAPARSALERAVEIEPASSAAWYRLGVVYARLGERELARAVLGRLQAMSAELAEQLARLIEPS